MQYGHCVVSATATAMSSLYFLGIAPSASAALSNAQKAFAEPGASAFRDGSFPKLFIVIIGKLSFSFGGLAHTVRSLKED